MKWVGRKSYSYCVAKVNTRYKTIYFLKMIICQNLGLWFVVFSNIIPSDFRDNIYTIWSVGLKCTFGENQHEFVALRANVGFNIYTYLPCRNAKNYIRIDINMIREVLQQTGHTSTDWNSNSMKWCLLMRISMSTCKLFRNEPYMGTRPSSVTPSPCSHDDVIKWKHFPRYWAFVRGIHRSPVNSPHKDQ